MQKSFSSRQTGLSAAKQALLEKRLRQLGGQQVKAANTIAVRPAAETVPLSFAQQRLWFLQQLEPDSAAYNEAIATRMTGPLDREVFARTIRAVIGRHEILRSRFTLRDGQVVQTLDEQVQHNYDAPYEDWRGTSAQELELRIQQRTQEELHRPFGLIDELPWRTFLFRIDDEVYISLSILHHMITDAWSMGVLYREIGQIYVAYNQGKALPEPETPLQYGDYAYWQQQWLESPEAKEQLAYWQKQLQAPHAVLDLPTDRAYPEIRDGNGQHYPVDIPQELGQQLAELGQQQGTTLFMTLLAGFYILLYRYSLQDDLLVGTPVLGRTRPELEALQGCFVNTLVLRTAMQGDWSVNGLLQRVRALTLEAYDHQDLPFEKLVEVLQPERSLSRNSLFQALFVLQNAPDARVVLPGLVLEPFAIQTQTAKFDLELALTETNNAIAGFIEYSTDVFDEETIARLSRHYVQILRAMVAQPTAQLATIELFSPEEQASLLESCSRPVSVLPRATSFVAGFLEQARLHPSAPAVSDEHEQLTYAQLWQRAAKIATRLRQAGSGPEQLVGLYSERSVTWAVGFLAILLAGGVYLPLDPRYPQARLQQILQQSHPRLLLVSPEQQESAGQILQALGNSGTVPQLFNVQELLEQDSSDEVAADPDGELQMFERQLAYAIYTSGSTGVPKGVLVEQRGMLNHLYAKLEELHLTPDDCLAQTASSSFDISIWQVLTPWLAGASVRIYSDEVVWNAAELLRQVARDGVSVLEFVPSWLDLLFADTQLPTSLGKLRYVLSTGEALQSWLYQRWQQQYPKIELINAYGPSECSDEVTHHHVRCEQDSRSGSGVVPIGVPLGNTSLYVLDEHLHLCPIGVVGEIYVGGINVGRGYLDEPERTAQAFIPDPWSQKPDARLYRTGDLGRYRSDGVVEFYGRKDDQVKLRGYRIELGEIEQVLQQQAGVKTCRVFKRVGSTGREQLVAYVQRDVERGDLQEALRNMSSQLPEYMIPTAVVFLDTWPLTANGKVDKKRLPDPKDSESVGERSVYVAPRTAQETQLVAIWQDVLGQSQIGIHDNFFALGGHSLLITQIIARVQDTLSVPLTVRSIFKNPTIEELAGAIVKIQERGTQLRKQAVTSVSREQFRQKRQG